MKGIDWSVVSDPAVIPLSELVTELAPLTNRQIHSRDDWSLRWGARDVGSYVLHRLVPISFSLLSQQMQCSLDFLETCSLLQQWYGSSYPFQNNPFALSYPLSRIWNEVCTDEMVSSLLWHYANHPLGQPIYPSSCDSESRRSNFINFFPCCDCHLCSRRSRATRKVCAGTRGTLSSFMNHHCFDRNNLLKDYIVIKSSVLKFSSKIP